MSTTEKEKSLENFDWSDGSEDFFGTADIPVEKEEEEIEVEEEEEKKPEKKVEKKKEKKKEEVDKTEEEFEEEETEKKKKEQEEDFSFSFEDKEEEEDKPQSVKFEVLSTLKDLGFLSEDLELEDKDVDDENFNTLLEEGLQSRVEFEVENFANSLDEDAKAFLKFKKAGGKTSDFFKTLELDTIIGDITEDDLEDETVQESFLIQYYQSFDGLDREEVEDKIEWLKDRGKLQKDAEQKYKKIAEQKEKEKELLLQKQKETEKTNKENAQKYRQDLQKTLDELDSVGQIKIPKKEKNELYEYMMKPNVKTSNNTLITGFQKDLAEVYQDKKMLIALAKIVKERFEISDLKETTKITKEIKKNLRKGSSYTAKSLADYF